MFLEPGWGIDQQIGLHRTELAPAEYAVAAKKHDRYEANATSWRRRISPLRSYKGRPYPCGPGVQPNIVEKQRPGRGRRSEIISATAWSCNEHRSRRKAAFLAPAGFIEAGASRLNCGLDSDGPLPTGNSKAGLHRAVPRAGKPVLIPGSGEPTAN